VFEPVVHTPVALESTVTETFDVGGTVGYTFNVAFAGEPVIRFIAERDNIVCA
jgi:hypothetical protein